MKIIDENFIKFDVFFCFIFAFLMPHLLKEIRFLYSLF